MKTFRKYILILIGVGGFSVSNGPLNKGMRITCHKDIESDRP